MTTPVKTLAEALPAEMARVRDEVLPQYLALRGMPNVVVEPQITIMRAELDEATRATMAGDVVAMLKAYNSLKEYST
jgi:hypothetical protein